MGDEQPWRTAGSIYTAGPHYAKCTKEFCGSQPLLATAIIYLKKDILVFITSHTVFSCQLPYSSLLRTFTLEECE